MKRFALVTALFLSCFIVSNASASALFSYTYGGAKVPVITPSTIQFPVTLNLGDTDYVYTDMAAGRSPNTNNYTVVFYNRAATNVNYDPNYMYGSRFWYGTTLGYIYNYNQGAPFDCSTTGYTNCGIDGTSNGNYQVIAYSTKDLYNFSSVKTFTANISQLTISLNPATGGTVTSDPAAIDCPGTSCQANFYGNITLNATPSADWVFSYWDDGVASYNGNPRVFSLTGNTTLTAKFFKTFTNRVGNFQASTGSTIDTGECVPYVRYETGVPIYGDAYTWYSQAVSANYATSTTVPRVGSIIVFAIQGGITSGHVGIVTSINGSSLGIRSQNWNNDEKVSDDIIDISGYTITGYIYYTP